MASTTGERASSGMVMASWMVRCLLLTIFINNLEPMNAWTTSLNRATSCLDCKRAFVAKIHLTTMKERDSDNDHETDIFGILTPHPTDVTQMSGTDLAYIGDVVFELFVRSHYVWPPKRTTALQTLAVECVRGKTMDIPLVGGVPMPSQNLILLFCVTPVQRKINLGYSPN